MAGRSWFYASEGQQQGPYPEIQLREFIARGTITADTLVWTEGMANWQRAGDIPGLVSGASGPPAMPRPGGRSTGAPADMAAGRFRSISAFGTSLWRSLRALDRSHPGHPRAMGLAWFYRWVVVPCVHVPGRPNLGFTGQGDDDRSW